MTTTVTSTLSKNIIFCYCYSSYFTIISSRLIWKMCINIPKTKLVFMNCVDVWRENRKFIVRMLASSTKPQIGLFHFVVRTRTAKECIKM